MYVPFDKKQQQFDKNNNNCAEENKRNKYSQPVLTTERYKNAIKTELESLPIATIQ